MEETKRLNVYEFDNVNKYLNNVTFVLGGRGSGKTNIIFYMLKKLKPSIVVIFDELIYSPYKKIVNEMFIHQYLTDETLECMCGLREKVVEMSGQKVDQHLFIVIENTTRVWEKTPLLERLFALPNTTIVISATKLVHVSNILDKKYNYIFTDQKRCIEYCKLIKQEIPALGKAYSGNSKMELCLEERSSLFSNIPKELCESVFLSIVDDDIESHWTKYIVGRD